MIPLYGFQAGGGKVYSLDDQTVVKDGAALDGSGGTAVVPFFVSAPLGVQFTMGYNKLRRLMQRLAKLGTVSIRTTGIRDGLSSATAVSRTLGLSDIGIINVPLNDAASDFQVKVEVMSYTAEVAFGDSEVYVVPKREFR